ncbi:FAD-binding oxidoreductase [Actibacterium sp. 188UL27-1]|uniref:NAD(P)/FAD-dependent oxidoreductase n=1 Tax=Actibacterium sp. 188UL27-1 TaxID=2786961 RepID=UPI00195A905F|nr:FAD-binding oxidoreductase [Actibacterium sp. 188UL27-1]MBM7066115.1 FAD-binding oxidoreductase [Actibacterium sp. 188UL27-1]
MSDGQRGLWSETAVPAGARPALEGDLSCDVTVVGAGFTGLRAAVKLAEGGARVVVVDAGDVGHGASGRSGGQVNPMLPFHGPEAVRRLVGARYFERLTEVSLGSADALFALIRRYQIDCQARQNGWVRVDHCARAARMSRANVVAWTQCGATMRSLDAADVRHLTGTQVYSSGTLIPQGGAIHPLSLVRGLARVAEGAGARIFGATRVEGLYRGSGGWLAETPRGRLTSAWVILATNGYTDGLWPGLQSSLLPLVPIQIASDPLPEDRIPAILPEGHTISDTRRVIMYARREPDDRIVFGGLGQMGRGGVVTGHDWLIRDAARIYPGLCGVDWRHRWGGRIALTDDRLPHLHEPAPGLIAGLGYNGRGVAMSHVMGEALADRALGVAAGDLPFPVSSIRRLPFRAVQLMGKRVAVGWMRVRDRLEQM